MQNEKRRIQVDLRSGKGPRARYVWESWYAVFTHFSELYSMVVRMVGTHFDLTNLKEAERALLESEKKWRDLTKVVPVVICQGDLDGKITFVNSE